MQLEEHSLGMGSALLKQPELVEKVRVFLLQSTYGHI